MSRAQRVFDQFSPRTAWQPYFPLGVNPWNEAKIAHLYRRAAFGASFEQIRAGLNSTPDELISHLIKGGAGRNRFEQECQSLLEGAMESQQPQQLKAWWLYRMLYSPHPLQERMTLFWHNHFSTSNAKVNSLRLMLGQHQTLRKHALGHFGEMLQAMTRDPAMILWLDSNTNKKGKPNENYAREVFELFSLGVGNYTEKDIQEAARALTGWNVENGKAVFRRSEFDDGEKTIFGRRGNWAAGDVVRIALEQPACSRFLVRKLFREFVGDTVEVSDEMLKPLADDFRIRNYDTSWLVSRLLHSWVFFSDAAFRQKIKPPVDVLVGTVRMLDGEVGPAPLAGLCDKLGQSLFYPPSVKGWEGGTDWLNSTTLLDRQNIAFSFTNGTGLGRGTDPGRLAEKHQRHGDETLVKFFLQLFLQQPDHDAVPRLVEFVKSQRRQLRTALYTDSAVEKRLARGVAHLVLTLPEFQLA